jgi:CysZ protein
MAIFSGIADFVKGFLFLPKGARLLAGERSLWKGILAPLLINILGFAASLYWSFSYMAGLVENFIDQQGWFWTALGFLSKILAFGLSVGVAVVAFLVIAALLAGPFNDWLGAATLRILGQAPLHTNLSLAQNLTAILRAMRESLKEVGYFLTISVVLFLLGWVPIIGLIAPVIGIPFLCYSLAFGTITPCLSDRDLSFHEKRRLLAKRRWLSLGFGCSCFLMLLIPLAGLFVLPVAVVGGALLYHVALRDASNSH